MTQTRYGVILLVGLMLCVGCAGKASPPLPLVTSSRAARTPQQAIRNMARAVAENDLDAYMASHAFAGPETEEMVSSFFETVQVGEQFKQKYTDVFGETAAKEYCGRTLRDVIVKTSAEECEYAIEDDTAVVTHPITKINMVRIDGNWMMEYRNYDSPTELELVRARTRMYGATMDVYRQLMVAIAEPGMTPVKLEELKDTLMDGMYDLDRHRRDIASE
jgi:hypothetical protein